MEGLCAYRVPDACMSTLVGFMVGVRSVFGVVVSPVFRARVLVVTGLVLGSVATEPPEVHMGSTKHTLCGIVWVMLVVPLLNSSICYFSFTLSRTKHK